MRINIKAVLKDYKGKDLTSPDSNGKEASFTVRDALNSVINGIELTSQGQQKPLTAEDKGRIYQLSTKLWSVKKELVLSSEEIVFIKKRLGVVVNITPLVFGRVGELLADKDEKAIKDK